MLRARSCNKPEECCRTRNRRWIRYKQRLKRCTEHNAFQWPIVGIARYIGTHNDSEVHLSRCREKPLFLATPPGRKQGAKERYDPTIHVRPLSYILQKRDHTVDSDKKRCIKKDLSRKSRELHGCLKQAYAGLEYASFAPWSTRNRQRCRNKRERADFPTRHASLGPRKSSSLGIPSEGLNLTKSFALKSHSCRACRMKRC